MRDYLAKAGFVFSVLVLGFFYEYATRGFGWFPDELLGRAWNHARAIVPVSGPHYLEWRVYDWSGVRVARLEEIQPAPNLLTGMFAESASSPGVKLIDRNGGVLHRWPINPSELFPSPPANRTRRDPSQTNIHGAPLYPNGDLIFNLKYVGTARIDACGDPIWTLEAGSHHSVELDDNGSFWIPGGSWRGTIDDAATPGIADSVYRDRLLHVSEDGEVLAEIDLLRLLFINDLERHISKGS